MLTNKATNSLGTFSKGGLVDGCFECHKVEIMNKVGKC